MTIINEFGSSLLEIDNNGKLILKKDELVGLILMISQIIISIYTSEIYKVEKNTDDSTRNILTSERLEELIKTNDVHDKIENIITNFKTSPNYKS